MEVIFANSDLDRLETDPDFTGGWPRSVVKGYRKVLTWIWAAVDERDFYNLRSLHYEKLHGRLGQHSMRLNDQYRLIVEYEGSGRTKRIVIVAIEDYH
ncbi:MAG: type II toxin-antitoxin system RelE/ParE family toxin [Dehalococcoidia bacterium]|nr:type II toxin-antitoxin system RelE/ParE family toxin [Dehalococcoidia bacterium]